MAKTPRIFCIRHGETAWSKTGQHTGTTDIPLLYEGARQAAEKGRIYVGDDKMIDPRKVRAIFCSPLKRAKETMGLVLAEHKFELPPNTIHMEPRIREWTYGKYEGWLPSEIRADRGGEKFCIWRDGCPDGESPKDITERVDSLIKEIRELNKQSMDNDEWGDILVFGHGHILRAFFMRWLNIELENYLPIVLPPAGVGLLSYEHDSIDEPSLYLG